MKRLKKKSKPLHLNQMSDRVQKKLTTLSNKTGMAKWVIAEKILEGGLGFKKDFDINDWVKGL